MAAEAEGERALPRLGKTNSPKTPVDVRLPQSALGTTAIEMHRMTSAVIHLNRGRMFNGHNFRQFYLMAFTTWLIFRREFCLDVPGMEMRIYGFTLHRTTQQPAIAHCECANVLPLTSPSEPSTP